MEAARVRQTVQKEQNQQNYVHNVAPKKKRYLVSLKLNELLLYVALMIVLSAAVVFVLNTKLEAHEYEREISQINYEINATEKEIDELTTEVTHLSSYERIYQKANELGLKPNNDNVKVVRKYEK